jgi:hypothetical protein
VAERPVQHSFGLFDFLVTLVLDIFGHCVPIHRIDDPFTILQEEVSASVRLDGTPVTLVPVRVPIRKPERARQRRRDDRPGGRRSMR